ncbi:MAG: PDDEXK nuclease domain-containing protein [Elusimicrobia bacterium]|nr:PDDEXK nuclease domain-containing protein [Elusimicrobiota bacterium]
MTKNVQTQHYQTLIKSIGELLNQGRQRAYSQVNNILVETYWDIGREIVEYEQKGNEHAEYGSELLNRLSSDLRTKYGKGFSRRNVLDMRRFYLVYPIRQTLSAKLTWSHYVLLLSVGNDLARGFYMQQSVKENWSVRELERQVNSMLFERLALSKKKKAVLDMSNKGHIVENEKDIIKEPYVLEFLNIPQSHKYSEKELERKIIDNIQMFLLELGKGFAFIGRQYRLSFSSKHYYVDLVFYHRILKCFVLIDLKIGHVNHIDIGQMNMYLNYFKKEEMTQGDNEPIGIILAADKDDVLVEYALGNISNKLFVSKYQLYLPEKKLLEKKLKELLNKEQ